MNMYSLVKTFIFLIAFCLFISSCSYDNEEDLFADQMIECDLEEVRYSVELLSVLDNKCLFCHGEASNVASGAGINLDGYENFLVWVDNGRMMGALNQEETFSPMPKGLPKLTQCELDQFQAWIDSGSPNN